jgi:pimeloyl-ACP methyl ester carboxylesterase
MPDVIVILPGILGSVLEKDGKAVWDLSAGAIMRGLLSLGGSVKSLTLDGDDPEQDDLGDGVEATELVQGLHLIPGLWKIDGYKGIRNTVEDRFEVTAGQNLFEFPYDWRRDNRVAARKLARATHTWLREWRDRSGNADARLILLAHSMGGLVSRHYLEALGGWENTRALVTFGTPYRGSLNALTFLANGVKKGFWKFRVDLTDMLRSFTSVYQLLPIYPVYDEGEGELRRVAEVEGIPGVDAAMAKAALAFHREIRSAQKANSALERYGENGYAINPIVGIDQPTVLSSKAGEDRVSLFTTYEGEDHGGDGVVPRVSALPPEWSSPRAGMFASEAHASLQNNKAVLGHVRGLLTTAQIDLRRFMTTTPDQGRLGLDIPAVVEEGETLEAKVKPIVESSTVEVTVTDVDRAEESRVAMLDPGSEEWRARGFDLPPGVYSVRARVPGAPGSVTDFAVVLPETEMDA